MIGDVLRQVTAAGGRVRVFGEMVALLWDAGQIPCAIEVEELWNDLQGQFPFSLFCAYSGQSLSGSGSTDDWGQVCRLHSVVQRRFAAQLETPGEARRFVVNALHAQGHSEDLVNGAALVVGELAANAVVRAYSPFTVVLSTEQHHVRIAIHDASHVLPVPRHVEPWAQSGHGLALVAAVSSGWGVERTSGGKLVWAELMR